LKNYPHQMSGGMRQRVMIAMAISCGPELMIADEPTTALDVTIQAQIMELIEDLQNRTGLAMLLITHNLGVVAETADEVAVMYLGLIVERAPVKKLFASPQHPYTQALLASLPDPDNPQDGLATIKGTVPSIFELPQGCRFKDRCPQRFEACDKDPEYLQTEEKHFVRCHLYA
jgi:peptide/nickel transport system ATP-binding protein